MNEREKIIDRVRKMLTLANNEGATEGERDNAMRMAHKLMVKYNIDSVDTTQPGKRATEKRIETEVEFFGRPWARNVALNVGRLFFCNYLFRSRYKSKQALHSFIGLESNATTAAEIAKFVVESIHKEGKKLQRQQYENNDWYRSFCWGAAGSVRRRVDQLIEEATKPTTVKDEPIETKDSEELPASTTGTALVVANLYKTELMANTEMVNQLYPKLNTARSGKAVLSTTAMVQGARYGKEVSLSRQLADSRIKGQLK